MDELTLLGGFRPARHAHLLKPAFQVPVTGWAPDAAQLAAQETAGRVFVEGFVAANELNDREGAIVLELGHVTSALASIRAVKREGLSLKDRGVRDRIERGWVGAFGSLMSLLRIT